MYLKMYRSTAFVVRSLTAEVRVSAGQEVRIGLSKRLRVDAGFQQGLFIIGASDYVLNKLGNPQG